MVKFNIITEKMPSNFTVYGFHIFYTFNSDGKDG